MASTCLPSIILFISASTFMLCNMGALQAFIQVSLSFFQAREKRRLLALAFTQQLQKQASSSRHVATLLALRVDFLELGIGDDVGLQQIKINFFDLKMITQKPHVVAEKFRCHPCISQADSISKVSSWSGRWHHQCRCSWSRCMHNTVAEEISFVCREDWWQKKLARTKWEIC